MAKSLMDILSSIATSPRDVVNVTDDCYGIVGDGFIAIAWDENDARCVLSGQIPDDAEFIDVNSDVILPSAGERIASKDAHIVAESFNGKPIIVRTAQSWGGHGNMPPGGGSGVGGGFGVSHPMSGTGNFENYIARQFFDQSLEAVRGEPDADGWSRSTEDRLQDAPLYGHQRNNQDHNLRPYLMTWEERAKVKKEEYLDRVRKNRREEKEADEFPPNSVAAIKATPRDPKHTESIESKLGNRRETDNDINFRANFHGPESEFVHYPKPDPKIQERTAATKSPRGRPFTIFDDTTHGEDMMERMLNAPLPVQRPKPRSTSAAGTEAGLAGLRGSSEMPEQPRPNQDTWQADNEVAIGGTQRLKEFPYSMRGPQQERPHDNFEDLYEHWRNGAPDQYNIELLMNHWPDRSNPGEASMPPLTLDEQRHIIELMQKRFHQDDVDDSDASNDQQIEKRLNKKHRPTFMPATERAAYEWYQRGQFPPRDRGMSDSAYGRTWRSGGP